MTQENTVKAIDIALEPDATMVRRALTDNASLLNLFRKDLRWTKPTIRT